jgi:hypothetical protein
MQREKEETYEGRRARIDRYERWLMLALWQGLLALIAWRARLSNGEWILGIMGITFASFVEHRLDGMSRQLDGLENSVLDVQSRLKGFRGE